MKLYPCNCSCLRAIFLQQTYCGAVDRNSSTYANQYWSMMAFVFRNRTVSVPFSNHVYVLGSIYRGAIKESEVPFMNSAVVGPTIPCIMVRLSKMVANSRTKNRNCWPVAGTSICTADDKRNADHGHYWEG